jgi:hypothetical protein
MPSLPELLRVQANGSNIARNRRVRYTEQRMCIVLTFSLLKVQKVFQY